MNTIEIWIGCVYVAASFMNGMVAIEKNRPMPIACFAASFILTPLVVWMYLVAVPVRK